MSVSIPPGWRTLERVILHFRIGWQDTANDAPAPPGQQSYTMGLRWMNAGAGLPDSDPNNAPTQDYLWCAHLPMREQLFVNYGTQVFKAGMWSPTMGVDITARRQMNTVDSYRAVLVTEPLDAFTSGPEAWTWSGYEQYLVSRTV